MVNEVFLRKLIMITSGDIDHMKQHVNAFHLSTATALILAIRSHLQFHILAYTPTKMVFQWWNIEPVNVAKYTTDFLVY